MTTASGLLRAGVVESPPALLPAIRLIKTLVKGSVAGHLETPHIAGFRDGSDSLISILGSRGSGKTTLLAAACAALERSNQALVLPTIRPEIFDATDSLLLAMLLELERALTQDPDPSGRQASEEDQLATALAEATRSVSVSTAGAYLALGASSETTGQYGVDAVTIVRHRTRLNASLARLFATFREHRGYPARTPVVVPIDDADLSPANLRSILTAVRVLGTITGVVPVICADRRQLEFAAMADIHEQYSGHLRDIDADRLAVQVVTKLLRPERCVSPPYLSERDRILFTPIGQEGSILQILDQVEGAPSGSLRALVWEESNATRVHEPRGVNAWLPETFRELEYVWESAVSLKSVLREREVAVRTQQVQRFVDNVLASSREYAVSVEAREVTKPTRRQADTAIALGWPSMNYGVTAQGRFTPAATSRQLRLRLRRLARFRAAVFPDVANQPGADPKESQRELTAAAVASVQALQQLVLSGLLGGAAPSSPSYIGEAEFEFLQTVAVHGQATDDLFLSMPDSCGMQAMTRAAIAWNRLVEDSRESNRNHRDAGAGAVVRRYIQLVVDYWLRGDERCLTGRRRSSLDRSIETASLEYLKRVRDDDVSHHDDYSMARAYCHWFELRLPYVFHGVLLGETRVDGVVARWLDAISAGPRGVEATAELRTALEGRFAQRFDEERRRKNGEHSWIFGYHALGETIGTELHADMLMFKSAYEERRRARAVGHDILGDSVGLSAAKGPYEYAAHRTVEGDEEMAVLREVLEQYRSR